MKKEGKEGKGGFEWSVEVCVYSVIKKKKKYDLPLHFSEFETWFSCFPVKETRKHCHVDQVENQRSLSSSVNGYDWLKVMVANEKWKWNPKADQNQNQKQKQE